MEKIQIDYDFLRQYLEDPQNTIGATTSTTLRNVRTHNDTNCKYVKKWGTDYAIGDITNAVISTPRSDGGGVNQWRFNFYGWDGSAWQLMARVTDANAASTFTDVAPVTASKVRIELEVLAGTASITNGDDIVLTTDVDGGGLTVYLSGEGNDMDGYFWYLSASGSTYYDEEYKHGGYRHSPTGTQKYPYFHPIAAEVALGGAFSIVTVLDSETYEVPDWAIDTIASPKIQSALGETPTLTAGIGARASREVEHDGNNSDIRYVSKTGNDANPGTYQEPYLTIQFTENNMGGRTYINIMDSETYEENLTFDSAIIIELLYGIIPIVKSTVDDHIFDITDTAVEIYGLVIDGDNLLTGGNGGIRVGVNAYAGTIKNNTIENCAIGIQGGGAISNNLNCTIESNYFNNNTQGIGIQLGLNKNAVINGNIFYDNNLGFITDITAGETYTINMANNLFIASQVAFSGLGAGATYAGTFENNTMTKSNFYGIWIYVTVITGIFRDCISFDNATFDLQRDGGAAATITESNYGTNSGWTIGAGCITSDPEFCRTTTPYKFGISANSGAYRADTSNDDMGAHFRMIEINQSNIELNGFIIDGQEQFNNAAFILDTVNHVGTIIKWCTLEDFQGISCDPYDNDTNTNCQFLNCIFRNNGDGLKLSHGGNTIEECLIYNNSVFGVHSDYTSNIFNHVIFFNNQFGIYFVSNSGSLSIKNSIFHQNSLYDIYSEVSIVVTYSCITGSVNNVDISDVTNITADPLFKSVVAGSEDFNIKSEFSGFSVNSLCLEAADDGKDIGAYDVLRSIEEEAWKKYVLDANPRNLNLMNLPKGQVSFEDILGSTSLWGKSRKIRLPMIWDENSYTTEEQWKKIKYLASLIPTRENEKTKIECRLRAKLRPTTFMESGTGGIVDTAAKTLTDASKNLIENDLKGFNLGVKFETGSGMVINAVAKTATKVGAGWDVDEKVGYYLKYNGYSYYVKSNTAEVLSLSDPYSTLVSATIDYSIEKYFEIKKNGETVFYLYDDDEELVSGNYDYYVDFVLSRVMDSAFGYIEPAYSDIPEWKTAYQLILEQI